MGSGGESKPLHIINRNHTSAASIVNDNSIAFLFTLDKGTKDGDPPSILFWNRLDKSTSHYPDRCLGREVTRIGRSHDS